MHRAMKYFPLLLRMPVLVFESSLLSPDEYVCSRSVLLQSGSDPLLVAVDKSSPQESSPTLPLPTEVRIVSHKPFVLIYNSNK